MSDADKKPSPWWKDYNHINPDLPPRLRDMLKDVDGNQDAEFVWEMVRILWKENARLAATNQRLREKLLLATLRYRRIRDRWVNFIKEQK